VKKLYAFDPLKHGPTYLADDESGPKKQP
jgi:polar amino acid transport system substrate-binding protein